MASDQERPFRFMELPAELRNKIYTLLLCSFGEPVTAEETDPFCYGRTSVPCTINTAILRTNSQVHQEAYDVMVKVNRFVHIKFIGNVGFSYFLRNVHLPIVSAKKASVSHFQGFAMTVSCDTHVQNHPTYPTLPSTEQDSAMILGQDSPILCLALTDVATFCAAHYAALNVTIDVAPVLKSKSAHYKPLFDGFFSETLHEILLFPYRRGLRSIKGIAIHGQALPEKLAQDICKEISQCEWTEPRVAIEFALEAKERGQRAWRAGDLTAASKRWSEAVVDIGRMHRGSSWPSLIERGGQPFIDKIAEIYFLICLNSAQAGLKLWTTSIRFPLLDEQNYRLIDYPIRAATQGLGLGNWKEGYTWQPSDVHLAKLRYRQAHFLRLIGGSNLPAALQFIGQALQLLPDDPVLLKERQIILQQRSHPYF